MREHNTIFSEKEIKAKIKNAFPKGIANKKAKLEIIENWQDNLVSGKYVVAKEEEIGSLFLNKFFGEVLDYKYDNPENWNLKLENKTEFDGTKADAALGYFKIKDKKEQPKDVRAVIEVKNARTPLDLQQARIKSLSPVEQGFMYAAKNGVKCKWVIISNFVEIRLYRASDMTKYESFDIMSLHNEYEFLRFYYLLAFGQLFLENNNSSIDILLSERLEREKNIENEFYQEYQYLRELFYYHLKAHNSEIPPLKLLEYGQTIIDRVIFISVIKDYELIPYNVVPEITDISNKSWEKDKQELWRQIKKFFIAIDEGFPSRMHKFNGGLFKNNEQINNLKIKDVFLKRLLVINSYDFKSDLDVNILGHIFEQSITDLEQLKIDILDNQGYEYTETDTEINLKIPTHKESKRKKDGIFYTPEEITNYIVKQTIGKLLQEKKDEIGITKLQEQADNDKNIKEQIILWNKYKEVLKNIKIIDPACGSGAFLSQAYNFLLQEWQTLFDIYEKLEINKIEKNGDGLFNGTNNRQKTISKIKKHIVNNNIFGVDLNFESVEITKLALWIKSANKNDVLATLDQNIKCGNSLISDKKISDKAFVWETEFKEIMDSGGFDIVVGNPPYVGEKGNKDVFRPLQQQYKKLYTKNADLIYFFFYRAIKLLKNEGLSAYITTNYYLSADSAVNLRAKLKDETFIYQIVNFNEIKLFKDALGQHNMITCFRKTNKKENDQTKIINVVTDKNISFSQIFENKDNEVEIFYQNNIFEGQNNYIRTSQKAVFLNSVFVKMIDNSVEINNICYVNTGFNSGADKISNSNFIGKSKGEIGDGIFIINENEYQKINAEDELIKKCYKSSDIDKYYSTKWQKLYVIYTNKDTEIDNYPKIKSHLKKYRKYLEIKREYKTGQLPWFSQHWAREIDVFTNKNKIVFPYRSGTNKFSFSDNDFFGSKDILYLRIKNEDFEIKYLLALLNSKLFYNWLFFKGKRKGKTLELYATPIKEIPIKIVSQNEQQLFVKLIDEIIKAKIKLSDYYKLLSQTDENNFERQIKINKVIDEQKNIIAKTIKKIDEQVYKLYKLTDAEIKIIENLK